MNKWDKSLHGPKSSLIELGLVADLVIEAIVVLEFEDGLRMEILLGSSW